MVVVVGFVLWGDGWWWVHGGYSADNISVSLSLFFSPLAMEIKLTVVVLVHASVSWTLCVANGN